MSERRATRPIGPVRGRDGESRMVEAAIPQFRAPLAILPEARKTAFLQHLSALATAGFAIPSVPVSTPRLEEELPEPELVIAACTSCAGWCCQGGARSHAYLDANAVMRWREANPDGTAADMVEAYAARLPQVSVRDSCVYHGARGCVLPREMRSDLCNAFYCAGLRAFGLGQDTPSAPPDDSDRQV